MQRIEGGNRVGIVLEQHQNEKIEAIAKRYKITKSAAHRILLDAGLESYAVYEGIGMGKVTELAIRVKNAMQNKKVKKIMLGKKQLELFAK